MIHRQGPFDQDQLVHALKGFLPYNGKSLLSYDIEYMDDELGEVMVANFIWINNQWLYVDSRPR